LLDKAKFTPFQRRTKVPLPISQITEDSAQVPLMLTATAAVLESQALDFFANWPKQANFVGWAPSGGYRL